MNKYKILIALLGLITTLSVAWAAFADHGKVLGSTFSTGSSDIKILQYTNVGTTEDNLFDELPGPNFSNIVPNWSYDYPIKLYNNGSTSLQLTSNSNYTTANDPDELRSYIFVEPFEWDDSNQDGAISQDEIGQSYGKKSIVKWKTEGFDLGTIDMGTVKGLVLRFSADNLSDTKQGKNAIYDFEFDAIQL